MSCMMLSPAHIATVAHGLAYLLNQSEMCQLSAADELRDALGACKYPHDFLYDDRRIYPVLYRHNEAAYEGRYKVEPDETDEVPAMPDNVPHLLHRLDYNKHYFLDLEALKALLPQYEGKVKCIYIVILTPILMSILSSENMLC